MSPSPYPGLAPILLRTIWIFQALAATPLLVFLSVGTISHFLFTFETVYDLVTSLSTSLMAGAIIFIVLVQRKIPEERTTIHLTLRFEILKATIATVMWAWLMSDSLLNPLNRYRFYDRAMRMKAAAFTSILLFVLFYPTVWYAARKCKCTVVEGGHVASDDLEESPLLRRPWPPSTGEIRL